VGPPRPPTCHAFLHCPLPPKSDLGGHCPAAGPCPWGSRPPLIFDAAEPAGWSGVARNLVGLEKAEKAYL